MSDLNITKQLVGNTPYKYGKSNKKRFITVHQTGNTRNGANAQMHANLQSNGNARNASWHWTVDDVKAVQSFDHAFQLWAAGDGRGDGNLNSIHVEICINRDGDYSKAVENGAKLVRYLCDMEGISTSNVKQHYNWSGKNCPAQIRANQEGISWSDFMNMVGGAKVSATPVKADSKPMNEQYSGDSIIDYLNMLKIDSSFANREKLAKQYGISGYKGTADQNLSLLNKMKKGEPSKASEPAASTSTSYKAGQKVKIASSAKKYSRSTANIPSQYKNKSYTIQQVDKDDVLLKELVSWVKKADLVGGSTASSSNTSAPKVGQTVKVKDSAKSFATGQSIASHVKGNSYKILQVKSDRVLLDGIMSWVKRSDIS